LFIEKERHIARISFAWSIYPESQVYPPASLLLSPPGLKAVDAGGIWWRRFRRRQKDMVACGNPLFLPVLFFFRVFIGRRAGPVPAYPGFTLEPFPLRAQLPAVFPISFFSVRLGLVSPRR